MLVHHWFYDKSHAFGFTGKVKPLVDSVYQFEDALV